MSEQVKPASEQKPSAVYFWLCEGCGHYYQETDEENICPITSCDCCTDKPITRVAFYTAPQADYKAQRDALLDFANHIATAPQLSGTGWQEMAQMVVASVKGGAT